MDLKQIKNLSLIDDYLQGNLNQDQKLVFEAKLDSDKEFAKEFSFVKELKTALANNRSESLKDKFTSWDKEKTSTSQNSKTLIMTPWIKYLAIAACISLLIFVGWNIDFKEKVDSLAIFETNFTPYPSEIIRNEGSNQGYIYYSNQDYNKAISLLKTSTDTSAFFFLGNSFLAVNEPLRAIATFNNYTGQKYKLAVQWYLALAHLQNNDPASAKSILEKLKLQKGAYGKKAHSLLEAI